MVGYILNIVFILQTETLLDRLELSMWEHHVYSSYFFRLPELLLKGLIFNKLNLRDIADSTKSDFVAWY